MSTTNSIASTTGTTGTDQINKATDKSVLGKDDFLKLMVAQMQNMDPMSQSSSDPSQSMAQMTQFSMLEQLTNLAATTEQLKSATQQAQSLALVGKTVSYLGSDAQLVSGVVERAQLASGKVSLIVGGVTVDPADLTEVK
jgi:flagellar basal-body rod modification protein FlgD